MMLGCKGLILTGPYNLLKGSCTGDLTIKNIFLLFM